jgi:hypothetical protein
VEEAVTDRDAWVPEDIDLSLPSAARVYDYLLGGGHNFAVDRAVGENVLGVLPDGRQVARSNRSFLRRAVHHLIEAGITQFLDLGSGIPTVGNVHEVAQQADPDARVVYVDYDQVAVAHSRLILEGNARAAVVAADLCRPDLVLRAPEVTRLIDFDRPVGLLMVAVFHFVPDERKPAGILASYRDALPRGSMLALSHLTADHRPAEMAAVVETMRNSRDPMYFRSHDDVLALFDGFDLVPPGLVDAGRWRPEPRRQETGTTGVYAGVGRRR